MQKLKKLLTVGAVLNTSNNEQLVRKTYRLLFIIQKFAVVR